MAFSTRMTRMERDFDDMPTLSTRTYEYHRERSPPTVHFDNYVYNRVYHARPPPPMPERDPISNPTENHIQIDLDEIKRNRAPRFDDHVYERVYHERPRRRSPTPERDSVENVRRRYDKMELDEIEHHRAHNVERDREQVEVYFRPYTTFVMPETLGNFAAAKDFFERNLSHFHHPSVFAQHAEMLLNMGGYKAFELLNPREAFGREFVHRLPPVWREPELDEESRSFRARSRPWSRGARKVRLGSRRRVSHRDGTREPTMYGGIGGKLNPLTKARDGGRATGALSGLPSARNADLWSDETHLLQVTWRLLNGIFIMRRNNTINKALDEAQSALENIAIGPDISSLEAKLLPSLVSLSQNLYSYTEEVLKRVSLQADWAQLYQCLLAQNHIQEFKDVFLATMQCFGLERTCQLFFGTASYRDRLLDDRSNENSTLHSMDFSKNSDIQRSLGKARSPL
ncbi:hypothetical protein BDZ45DRAFT_735186 [Acephala macrosclerotiorum]|nr:hypothetical protein BDZ45DRAFT_735186 [Acephala macrosclerotiorum]